MKKKDIEKYQSKYGEVPKNFVERFDYLLSKIKLNTKSLDKLKTSVNRLLAAKWTKLDFVIYFTPKSTPRPRTGASGIFYVKGAADNNKAFKEFIQSSEHTFDIITTPTKLVVDIYLPLPTGMTQLEKILAELRLIRPITKPDWDNAGKTYSDMIQKHLLLEDSLIIDGRTRKYYSAKPRIEIQLEFMNKYDCNFNKKKVEGWKFYTESPYDIEDKDSLV